MRYVDIPNTDLRVSAVCLGSSSIGSEISAPDSFALLDEFAMRGGSFIDTAHIYADWLPVPKGISEKTIGQWLEASGIRDQIVIATKGAHPRFETMRVSRLARADIMQDLSESLDYLQVDCIDLYWLHRDDPAIPVGEIIDALDEQVQAGTIRYFGASNWTIPRIQAALDYAARAGKRTFIANQPLWSLAHVDMTRHADQTLVAMDDAGIAFHRRTGMAAIPYSSQAMGFFTRLDALGRSGVSGRSFAPYDNATNRARLERIRSVARRRGASVNDVVLAYLLAQPFPTIPVVGCKRIDQLHASLRALDLTLTLDELAYLETA
jgi:aryl-alcohol dehydrogenase-like predicted oxidoreductase